MRGCWTLMVRYDQPLDLPFDAAFVNRGPLRWVAREPSKPGRPARETWLLHASAAWSEAHIEADRLKSPPPGRRLCRVGRPTSACGNGAPLALCRYGAGVEHGLRWDAERRIGLCGDWLNGGKVEGLAERHPPGRRDDRG
jgi:predicted NAD/FAD-dependent oxidoreductase